eukprot:m.500106 g.500106  ORF g.500106 m.500106 type:complete len:303 (+) comp21830_c0_seq3:872-1780(+)
MAALSAASAAVPYTITYGDSKTWRIGPYVSGRRRSCGCSPVSKHTHQCSPDASAARACAHSSTVACARRSTVISVPSITRSHAPAAGLRGTRDSENRRTLVVVTSHGRRETLVWIWDLWYGTCCCSRRSPCLDTPTAAGLTASSVSPRENVRGSAGAVAHAWKKVRRAASLTAPPSLGATVSHHQCSLPATSTSSTAPPSAATTRAMRRVYHGCTVASCVPTRASTATPPRARLRACRSTMFSCTAAPSTYCSRASTASRRRSCRKSVLESPYCSLRFHPALAFRHICHAPPAALSPPSCSS